jgi:hypothetical protein
MKHVLFMTHKEQQLSNTKWPQFENTQRLSFLAMNNIRFELYPDIEEMKLNFSFGTVGRSYRILFKGGRDTDKELHFR